MRRVSASAELRGAMMIRPRKLVMAGFAVTAVSFGPGRIGFGLFLPRLRESFEISKLEAGLMTSLAFAAFLLALALTLQVNRQTGPRRLALLGAGMAVAGCGVIANAPSTGVLAAGVALAGASAGLVWAPFNDAAAVEASDRGRAGVLSVVSTGAAFGVLLAAAAYLLSMIGDLSWRIAWGAFAVMACTAFGLVKLGVARYCAINTAAQGPSAPESPALLRRSAWPLYTAALGFGMANGAYLSYAALHVVQSGGLPGLPDEAAAALIFLVYGVVGLCGLAAGWTEARIGLPAIIMAIFGAFGASLALIALAPTSWSAVLVSAGLHGAAVMTISAVLSFWSLRIFPEAGTTGFTLALMAVAAGSVLGPAAAGAIASLAGLVPALIASIAPALAIALAAGLVWTRHDLLPALARRPGRAAHQQGSSAR